MLTIVSVRQPASACRTYSAGLGASLWPEQDGGSLASSSNGSSREASSARRPRSRGCRAAVRSVEPAVRGAKHEARELGLRLERVERPVDLLGVDAVADRGGGGVHGRDGLGWRLAPGNRRAIAEQPDVDVPGRQPRRGGRDRTPGLDVPRRALESAPHPAAAAVQRGPSTAAPSPRGGPTAAGSRREVVFSRPGPAACRSARRRSARSGSRPGRRRSRSAAGPRGRPGGTAASPAPPRAAPGPPAPRGCPPP